MKLAAFDLDGTLLNSHHELLEENTRVLRKVQKTGVKIALATGRSVVSAAEMLDQMQLEGYILALNGTYIVEKTKRQLRVLRSSRLNKAEVQTAFDIAQKERVTFIASNHAGSDRVSVDEQSELIQEFLIKRKDLRYFSPEEMQKRIMDDTVEYLKLAFTNTETNKLLSLKQRLAEVGLPTIFSDSHYIEYVPKGVNKGTALQFLCTELGISMEETFAIGDQENDIELLQMSGIGVAMGNAHEHIKTFADFVTTTNDEAGVANALKRYL